MTTMKLQVGGVLNLQISFYLEASLEATVVEVGGVVGSVIHDGSMGLVYMPTFSW